MKKLLISLLILGITPKLFAYSWADLVQELKDNSKMSILTNATPAYFYDAKQGRSGAGVITDLASYRFFSANAGWVTGYDDPARGSIVLGGNLHINQLLAQVFPNATAVANGSSALFPGGLKAAWDHIYLGTFMGLSTTGNEFTYGFVSGLQFQFP